MKPKLVLISGLTGVGKTVVASGLAKRMNTEVIVGDSLQLYKNYPIAANFPPAEIVNKVKYNLLGQVDVFKQRIIVSEYKEMVLNQINRLHKENKVPIIEGGSGFYLNYLLTMTKFTQDEENWNEAMEKAAKLRKDTPDWNLLVGKLKEICPSYDDSLIVNDFYRLEKALRYAIASKGEAFAPRNYAGERLYDLFDVRGFMITMEQEQVKNTINARCYQMMVQGMLEEFLDFIDGYQESFYNYEDGPIPVGFQEMTKLVNSLIDLQESKEADSQHVYKKVFDLFKEFMSEFQIKSRRYAMQQRKYCRSKFKYFMWKETPKKLEDPEPLIEEILKDISLPEQEFKEKTDSSENQAITNKLSQVSVTRKFGPEYNYELDNLMTQRIINVVLPRLVGRSKLKIFDYVKDYVNK